MKAFQLAGIRVAPGTMARVSIPLAKNLAGYMQPMSVIVAHGVQEGPVLGLSAAVHGDELNGIPIIRQLTQMLDPKKLRGTLIATPVVNVFGLNQRSRYLPDNRDLNRCFPGARKGSLGARIADHFLTQVVSRCTHAVDFHTGASGRENWPQIRCNLDDAEVRKMGRAFAAPGTLHASLREGSLRKSAGDLGVRMLLFEAGEAGRFCESSIEVGVRGTLSLCRHLDMLDVEEPKSFEGGSVELRGSKWVRAPRTGFCRHLIELGQRVEVGQSLAHIFDSVKGTQHRVEAKVNGYVIGRSTWATLYQGDALCHIANEVKA